MNETIKQINIMLMYIYDNAFKHYSIKSYIAEYILNDFNNASISLTPKYDVYTLVRDSIFISYTCNNRFRIKMNVF